jgi:hypothetical protein
MVLLERCDDQDMVVDDVESIARSWNGLQAQKAALGSRACICSAAQPSSLMFTNR